MELTVRTTSGERRVAVAPHTTGAQLKQQLADLLPLGLPGRLVSDMEGRRGAPARPRPWPLPMVWNPPVRALPAVLDHPETPATAEQVHKGELVSDGALLHDLCCDGSSLVLLPSRAVLPKPALVTAPVSSALHCGGGPATCLYRQAGLLALIRRQASAAWQQHCPPAAPTLSAGPCAADAHLHPD